MASLVVALIAIVEPVTNVPLDDDEENDVTVGAVVSTVTVSPVDVDVTVELERYVVDSAVTTLSPAVNTSVSHDHSPVVAFAVHVLPEATALSDAASRSRTYNCTVEPTGAEPVKVSVVADVMLSVDELPKSSVA
jgi:hypothetical protein